MRVPIQQMMRPRQAITANLEKSAAVGDVAGTVVCSVCGID